MKGYRRNWRRRKGMGVIDGMRWFLYSTEERKKERQDKTKVYSLWGMNLVIMSHEGVGDCRRGKLR
jgi:hypothetical protein